MSRESRPLVALLFSVLLVTSATVGPAVAALDESPQQSEIAASTAPSLSTAATSFQTTNNSTSVEPVNGTLPQDLDGDGLYQDLNGNDRIDSDDAVVYFDHTNKSVLTNHTAAYDYNGNGRIDFDDVKLLANEHVDRDGDELVDERERAIGTNATNNDTDGDTLLDGVEANSSVAPDSDGDGRINALDVDSDDDGVRDSREGTTDTDGDGIPNYRDTDDDGDGISTSVELTNGTTHAYDANFDGVVNWRDADADGDGISDGEEGLGDDDGDGVPNYLDNDEDNDGLPSKYERNVTGTDPLDNDSDAAGTFENESGNEIIDGVEDFDEDTLPTAVEYRPGTDPFTADTDNDGLGDGYEKRQPWADPLVADTDGDGVSDGESDRDGDGLDNAREVELGTAATRADTDGDGLDDAAEVKNGTDPLAVDTDEDGLADPSELDAGTDPIVADTDGDSTLDGNETLETTASDTETGVNISAIGTGDVASGIRIQNASRMTRETAGPTVHLENETSFDEATVTVPVNESLAANTSANVTLYKWNGTSQDAWKPLNTTIDAANGTATATVTSFSYVTPRVPSRYERDVFIDPVDPVDFESADGFSCIGDCRRSGTSVSLLESNETIQPPRVSGVGATDVDATISVDLKPDVPADVDHVVATDGSGDYTTIQDAVNAARDGDTILVKEGTYREQVDVNTSVSLVGQHATLNGSGLDGRENDAVHISASADVSGFEIRGYDIGIRDDTRNASVNVSSTRIEQVETGISARDSTSNWSVSSVAIRNSSASSINADGSTGNWSLSSVIVRNSSTHGVHATNAAGDWSLSSVIVQNASSAGVYAYRPSGNWSLSSVRIRNADTGIYAPYPTGKWSVSSTTIQNASGNGITAHSSAGNWSLSSVAIQAADDGIEAFSSTGNWSLSAVAIRESRSGIDASGSGSNWSLVSVAIQNTSNRGIGGDGSDGDWSLSSVTVRNSAGEGISARGSDGDWSLSSVAVRNASGSGIDSGGSEGSWSLSSVTVRNSSDSAIVGGGSSGNWSVSSVDVRNASGNGIVGASSTGEWSLSSVKIQDTTGDGVFADDSAGDWSLSAVTIHDSTGDGITADSSTGNWSLSSVDISNSSTGVSVRALDSSATWSVRTSAISESSKYAIRVSRYATATGTTSFDVHDSALTSPGGINNTAPNVTIDATHNWWGQSDGPTADQVNDNVTMSNPCTGPCGSADVGWDGSVDVSPSSSLHLERSSFSSLSAGSGSKASWDQYLRSTNRTQIGVGYTAQATSENAWVTLTAETDTGIRSWRLPVTNGTTREQLNTTTLAGDARVTLRAVGADLDVDGLRVRYDDDGDGLWNHVEREQLRPNVGPVSSFSTNPYEADTDGDGLLDSEEIRVVPASDSSEYGGGNGFVVDDVSSNPSNADTDGDRLSDYHEVHSRTTVVYETQTQARNLISNLTQNTETNIASFASNVSIDSNPLVSDTDGDGLNDEEEWQLGTDPRDIDTDKDTGSDYDEWVADTDPTLFDRRPPSIRIYYANWYSPQWTIRNNYEINFGVDDPSQVETVVVETKGGATLYTDDPNAVTEKYSIENATDWERAAGENLGGTSVFALANDTHENRVRTLALSRPNAISQVLIDDGTAQDLGWGSAAIYGGTSGFLYGGGELGMGVGGVGRSVAQPVETFRATAETAPMLLANLDTVAEQMPRQFHRRQAMNNPFPSGTAQNESFEKGFVAGYGLFFATEIYVTGGAASTLSKSQKVQKASRIASKSAKFQRAYRTARFINHKRPSKVIGRTVAKGGGYAREAAARQLLSRSNTMGRMVQTRQKLSGKVPDSYTRVQDQYRRTVAKHFYDVDLQNLNRHQLDEAGKLLARDGQRADGLLRRMDDAEKRAFLDPDIDPAVRKNIYDGWKSDRLVSAEDAAASARKYKKLEGDVTLDETIDIKDVPTNSGISKKQQFRAILSHDNPRVRNSWIRTTSTKGVNRDDITTALERYYINTKIGHTPHRFLTGSEANRLDDKATDPHKQGSVAIEFKPSSDDQFVKVGDDSRPQGEFLTRPSRLRTLDSREEVMNRLALKEKWGNYNRVSRLEIDGQRDYGETKIRISTTSSVKDRSVNSGSVTRDGGFTQYQIVDERIESGWNYDNPRDLDEWLKQN